MFFMMLGRFEDMTLISNMKNLAQAVNEKETLCVRACA